MSKTPICDKHKYETDLGAEVVPFHVAIELELKLHQRELEIGEANAKWLRSDKQLAEVRADADHWKSECNALQRMAHEARAEIERLNKKWADEFTLRGIETSALERTKAKQLKLIGQMREALEDAFDHICPDGDPIDARELEVCNKIETALAAERGE